MAKWNYDGTVARIAGNVMASTGLDVKAAVRFAREIVAEVERTESETTGAGKWTIDEPSDVQTDSRPKEAV